MNFKFPAMEEASPSGAGPTPMPSAAGELAATLAQLGLSTIAGLSDDRLDDEGARACMSYGQRAGSLSHS